MNSLNDLRSALDRHAALAPDALGLVEQAQSGAARIRRHRRFGRAAAAAVAVLIVGAAAPTVVRLRESAAPVGAPAGYRRNPDQLTLGTAGGSRLTLVDVQSRGSTQFAFVRMPGDRKDARMRPVAVYDPGSLDPADLRRGRQLTVAGQPAWLVTDYRPDRARTAQTVLGWQDPSGAWVTVSPDLAVHRVGSVTVDQAMLDELRTIAAGLRIGPARPYPVPYRLGWLPRGVRVEAVSTAPQAPDFQSSVELSTDRKPPNATSAGGPPRPTVSVRIDTRSRGDHAWAEVRDTISRTKTTVGGHPARYAKEAGQPTQSTLAVEIGTCGIVITADRSVITVAELERLVAGITVADCADPATWGALR